MEKKMLVRVNKWQFAFFLAISITGILLLAEHTFRSAGTSVGKVTPIRAVHLPVPEKISKKDFEERIARGFERYMDSVRKAKRNQLP